MESNLPTEDNRTLSVKTKNLKAALQNLDLISEGEEKNLENNKKKINKNIIKKAMSKFMPTKIDYKEMDIFAKTLMGSHNWGGEIYINETKIIIFIKCQINLKNMKYKENYLLIY